METKCNGNSSEGTLLPNHNKSLAQLLAQRQWWKVCWVYGDQQKFYRQLYGRRKNLTVLRATATTTTSGTGTPSATDAGDDDEADSGGGSPSPALMASTAAAAADCFHASE